MGVWGEGRGCPHRPDHRGPDDARAAQLFSPGATSMPPALSDPPQRELSPRQEVKPPKRNQTGGMGGRGPSDMALSHSPSHLPSKTGCCWLSFPSTLCGSLSRLRRLVRGGSLSPTGKRQDEDRIPFPGAQRKRKLSPSTVLFLWLLSLLSVLPYRTTRFQRLTRKRPLFWEGR